MTSINKEIIVLMRYVYVLVGHPNRRLSGTIALLTIILSSCWIDKIHLSHLFYFIESWKKICDNMSVPTYVENISAAALHLTLLF